MSDGHARLTLSEIGKDSGVVSYEIKHVELDGGETQLVRLTFDVWGVSAAVDFHLDQADEFLAQFRDEIVRAKRARLEWETDTDPNTGVTEDANGD